MQSHEHTHAHKHSHAHEHAHPDDVHNPHRPDLAFVLAKTFVLRLEIDGQCVDIPAADRFSFTIQPKENGQRGNPLEVKGWVDETGRVRLSAVRGTQGYLSQTLNP